MFWMQKNTKFLCHFLFKQKTLDIKNKMFYKFLRSDPNSSFFKHRIQIRFFVKDRIQIQVW